MTTPEPRTDWLLLNVDDYEPARYAKTRVLRAAGYNVLEAGRGDTAIALIEQHHPDLVLLDVKLPDMSGLDVCRRIKANPNTASTLIIQNSASFVNASDQVRGLEGGADTYLTAPVDPTVLVATVAALLRIATAERKLRASQEQLRVLMEKERAAREAAERADRMKDEFLATLSHELRTPMNAVMGWTQVLKKRTPDAELLAKGLDVIERNGRLQAQLIEDLLDMSRILSGKLRLNIQSFDPAAAVDAAIASLQPAADAKGVTIERSGPPATSLIWADPARLQQVIWNLLSNAIKFTASGGRVHIGFMASGASVRFTVADTGIGIDPAFLPHIFGRFRQADASITRRYGGLGIGLSVVKNLAELHGGTASAHSAGPGTGATFTIELPHMPPRAAEDDPSPQVAAALPARPPRTGPSTPEGTLAGAHILAVDDDQDARDLMRRVLEDAGATVMTAASADEAIQAMHANCPDLIISDIGMPDQDGFDLIRRIRAMDPKGGGLVVAAALTAMARTEDCRRALAAGFNIHLAKPIDPADLVDVAASLLAQRAQNS